MKLPRRSFLHLAAGAAATAGRLAHRVGTSLSVAAGALARRFRRPGRHPGGRGAGVTNQVLRS